MRTSPNAKFFFYFIQLPKESQRGKENGQKSAEYTYNSLDLVSAINYNEGKSVAYAYNKVGELVKMDDWTGTNTFGQL